MLRSPEFSVRNIMRKMNVRLVCTTEGPLDPLDHHGRIKQDGFEVKVHTAWRPDPAMAVEDLPKLNVFIDKLEELCDIEIASFHVYIEALRDRHAYFHSHGCRLSDHGLDTAYAEDYTDSEIRAIFEKIRTGRSLNPREILQFKSAMMVEFALMDAECGWVQQLHIGALRNNCTRLFKKLGPDIGCDSIGDLEVARPLSKFLDRLDAQGSLPKTILYNLNPRDNAVYATMIGNFQDGSVPGKLQYGSGWWFLDQKDGMEDQMRTLAEHGPARPLRRHADGLAQLPVLPASRVLPPHPVQPARQRRGSGPVAQRPAPARQDGRRHQLQQRPRLLPDGVRLTGC